MSREARSRAGRWLVAAVVLVVGAGSVPILRRELNPATEFVAAANALAFRTVDARLAERIKHRSLRVAPLGANEAVKLREAAAELHDRWQADRSAENGRLAGAALLATGRNDQALAILDTVLHDSTGEEGTLDAIHRSQDRKLLIDFSAAALQRNADARSLLLAYEAADRAWRLERDSTTGWNRALAAERIGMPSFAARAWQEAAALDASSDWTQEALKRGTDAKRRAATQPASSAEVFFHRELVTKIVAGQPVRDVIDGDHLASDVALSFQRLGEPDRQRAMTALTLYAQGCRAFADFHYEEALGPLVRAEAELGALDIPLVLLARDQRIRAECSQGKPGCVEAMRTFRKEVSAFGRYPWLAARAAYGEGQALYRQGRIYEAAEHLQRAIAEFERLGDAASAGFLHALLGNVFAAAGESSLALDHHLQAVARRSQDIATRRRRLLEDVMLFLLRHGFLSSTELLLDELATTASTDASRAMEPILRGVIAYRRGDARTASQHFERAHDLLGLVKDDSARAAIQLRFAIAEAGLRMLSPRPVLAELDAAIAAHERTEYSAWLPQLLTERGAALESTNDLVRAESDYVRAIEILEQREPRIDETVLALGITHEGESPFDRGIRLMLRQRRIAGALSIAQRATALRISSLHARGAGVRDPFRQQRGDTDAVTELRKRLHPDQIAVAQHLLPDELITWIVSSDEIRATRRQVETKDLVRRAEAFRQCAARSGCKDEAFADAISDVLLRDWIDRVPRDATLLMQPPAELQAVVFPLLKTRDGQMLVTRNSVATASSFRAFAQAWRLDTARAGDLPAFFAAAPGPGGGLDPLPLSVSETTRASRSYPRSWLDTQATRRRFLERSRTSSIVHFAGHVVVNPARPLFSALAFQNGEMLYVHELDERSFANARMVVLSGCDTGRSPRPTMSVANALLSQGVPSVVYTHWPVTDAAAEAFAIQFHRAIAAGRSRADAVRDAQNSLRKNRPEEPEWWAAFALAGTPGGLQRREGEKSWPSIN